MASRRTAVVDNKRVIIAPSRMNSETIDGQYAFAAVVQSLPYHGDGRRAPGPQSTGKCNRFFHLSGITFAAMMGPLVLDGNRD